jgi:arylsulfatase A-like enzyme
MVTTMDLFPTLMDIAQVEAENITFDGMNIMELLKKPESTKLPERPLYFYARNGKPEAVRFGKWKLHITKTNGWNKDVDGEFPVSLYDLDEDMYEQNNVADQYPDIVKKLTNSISEFDQQL